MLTQFAIDFFRLCLWLLILMMIFVPLERLSGLHPQRVFRKSFLIDLGYYFLNNLLPKLILIVPMALVGWAVHRLIPSAFYSAVAALPLASRVTAALVVGELGFYWGHRWSHEIPFLWHFHAIHHSAEEMDWLVNTRAHPVDMVFTRLCGFIPIYVLGLSQPSRGTLDYVSLTVIFISTLWGFFIHANLKWRFPALDWLVTTPAFHHWHHTRKAPLDKNFAALLPCMDMLFGSHHMPRNEWPEIYGVEAPVPADMAHQLMDPLLAGFSGDASARSLPGQ